MYLTNMRKKDACLKSSLFSKLRVWNDLACSSNFHSASIKLLLSRGWRMSIIPTRHKRVLPKLQFCTGNNSRRENHPIKARKESRPFNWILKTFLPGPARTYVRSFILFNNRVSTRFSYRRSIQKDEKTRMIGAREICSFVPSTLSCRLIFAQQCKSCRFLCSLIKKRKAKKSTV